MTETPCPLVFRRPAMPDPTSLRHRVLYLIRRHGMDRDELRGAVGMSASRLREFVLNADAIGLAHRIRLDAWLHHLDDPPREYWLAYAYMEAGPGPDREVAYGSTADQRSVLELALEKGWIDRLPNGMLWWTGWDLG